MQVRFLIGPSGSGKTYRCLEEIRAELRRDPQGPPLILLAPKQATFQLERQILSDPALAGYARLQIFSFERLSQFAVEQFSQRDVDMLSEEGRLMVLRALLAREQGNLKIFRATARMPGFAQQLSALLRELQHQQVSPEKLFVAAQNPPALPRLGDKLHDLALLLSGYQRWLEDRQLEDANRLLDFAAKELRKRAGTVCFEGLWLDGFAEMTPQEQEVLTAVMPLCRRATLAFCLPGEVREEATWLSTWSVVAQTFRQCRTRISALENCEVITEILPRGVGGRFSESPALAHLEAQWSTPVPQEMRQNVPVLAQPVQLLACDNPEAEAQMVARKILEHVRLGGRYREVAVLVRRLGDYATPLRRTFNRYQIPFFLDQREPVSHHPLAELTRCALRVAAYAWKAEDWFGALKSGLVHPDETRIDELENAALEKGWQETDWLNGLPANAEVHERFRAELVPPFARFCQSVVAVPPGGIKLANALRQLWDDLRVSQTLEQWSLNTVERHAPAVHLTVWHQMHDWLDNLERAFSQDAMPLREWLPIIEAGLAGLSVGVIPPALDQVVVGAVDRSRNPDLQQVFVLGMNEGHFPAPPVTPVLLNENEREALADTRLFQSLKLHQRLAHERYYGYIAFTRARRRLVLSYSLADGDGGMLNPSAFIGHLCRLFPDLEPQKYSASTNWVSASHTTELIGNLLADTMPDDGVAQLVNRVPALQTVNAQLESLRSYLPDEHLAPSAAEKLYGKVLKTSVSSLEQFGMCPFRFFIRAGMRAEERKFFEVGVKELGTFQHSILENFHLELELEHKKWRDITPAEARQRIESVALKMSTDTQGGLFAADAANRFSRKVVIEALQNLVAILVDWMRSYQFDPATVELSFGISSQTSLPAWELPLEHQHGLEFRGVVDRVDLCPAENPDEAYCAVIDYKSSKRTLDMVFFEHGIQLQLPAYLCVLRQVQQVAKQFKFQRLIPAGMFYLNLKGRYESATSRQEASEDVEAMRRKAYKHEGRFKRELLSKFDSSGTLEGSGQFSYKINKDGSVSKNSQGPLPAEEFDALLDQVERTLKDFGNRIYAGEAEVSPYKKSGAIACDKCDYPAVCRTDPWNQKYRVLKKAQKEAEKTRTD